MSLIVQLNTARTAIQRIGQPTLFTIGIIGTLLNIVIFSRRTMRQNSCALYFHANSWANFIALTWGVLASMLASFTKNNPATYNEIYCKIRFFMISFGQYSSRVFLVLACLDRLLLCSTSVRQRNFCRPKIAQKLIIIAIIICSLSSIHILITYKIDQNIICGSIIPSVIIYETVAIWLFLLLVPALLMSIFSGLIIRKLKQNAKRVGREHIHVAGRDMNLAVMLFGQVILYLITNVPFAALVLYGYIIQSTSISSISPERIAIENFTNTFISSFLLYWFNGLSFFVYTLTAPSFRRELLTIVIPREYLQKIQSKNHRHTSTVNPMRPSEKISKIG